ncbi:Hypothetical protein PHPALM_1204 [Phytophthora palmivora]|uniref:Uncharacterized protein n=1 Tax=Phytophthora palmivora TaxID=4796 RepID=A0A2P4YSY1_9STRA|nr:Hypothetical protein PHPALM_1204 [Phytophthora palmivora]
MSYVLGWLGLHIEFARLTAKRQLHSVMEGLRQQSKSRAHDERWYGSVNPGIVHHKATKSRGLLTPQLLLLIPELNSLRAVNPEPGFLLPRLVLPRALPLSEHSLHREEVFSFQLRWAGGALTRAEPNIPGPSSSSRASLRSLLSYEGRRRRDPVLSLALKPTSSAATQTGKSGAVRVLCKDVNAPGRETREHHETHVRERPRAC